jgi:hypothetical protein
MNPTENGIECVPGLIEFNAQPGRAQRALTFSSPAAPELMHGFALVEIPYLFRSSGLS